MNKPLKIIKIGNSAGVILPKEELQRLGLDIGGDVNLTRTPQGIQLNADNDADFSAQLEAAREIMKKRRSALRELAK